eukprot:gene13308-63726_t
MLKHMLGLMVLARFSMKVRDATDAANDASPREPGSI